MKDDFNIWKDCFGYVDMDFDGDVDVDDATLEDEIFYEVEKRLRPDSTVYSDDSDFDDDFDDDDKDDFDDDF